MEDEELSSFDLEIVPLDGARFNIETEPDVHLCSSIEDISSLDIEERHSLSNEDSSENISSLHIEETNLNSDEDDDFHPLDKDDVVDRLYILGQNGHAIEFNSDMSLEEFLKIYETELREIMRKNEEESQRAQLSMAIFFIEQQGLISSEEAIRLMRSEVPLQEIVNTVIKYSDQLRQGMEEFRTQWNNLFNNIPK